MLVVNDLTGLLSLVQAGVAEIHPWGSTTDHLDHPDRLIFDLDPGEAVPWSIIIEAARDVRDRLAAFGLQSFVKTSGGKGLHVVVPIRPRADWEEAKAFTKAVAEKMAKERPDRYVAMTAKRIRSARIFVDYLRNAAAPPRLQLTRLGRYHGRRCRPPSLGMIFRRDFVQITLPSETCRTGFPVSNEILGRISFTFVRICRIAKTLALEGPASGAGQLPQCH